MSRGISKKAELKIAFTLFAFTWIVCFTGDRPHICSICPKSFTTKDALNKHLVVHTDDRNFKCGVCGKLFKRIGHVKEHLKIHNSDRPFACTFCDKAFKTHVSTSPLAPHLHCHHSREGILVS